MIAGLFPLDVLGELISIGILLAFTGVCIGVLVLRYTQAGPAAAVPRAVGARHLRARRRDLPDHDRTSCRARPGGVFADLVVIGLSIYGLYGYRHSRLRAEGR